MRDSRRARLILAMLLLTAFTLITLDYRSGGGGPLRSIGNAVFGPVERAASAVTRPIGSFFSSLGHLSSYKSDNAKLRKQNEQLLERLRLTDADRARLAAAEKLLNLAGRAQFRIVAAKVVGVGSSLGFESTATVDVGTADGIKPNQTVIDGDGLVGKTLSVGPTTSTILLGNDPDFTAGARLEGGGQQIGHVDGGGRNPVTFTLLGTQSRMKVGDRLVTFASIGGRPFVPEVPIGHIIRIEPTPGQLFSTGVVAPYVDFNSVDVVGIVVAVPRTIKRDSLLPPSPTPSPSPSSLPSLVHVHVPGPERIAQSRVAVTLGQSLMRRGFLATAIVLTALMIQAVVINPLPLPGGGPDLPVLVVVAFALVEGPTYGVILGFLVGLAADVLPPADHTIGRLALAYAVVGYLAGLVEDVEERSVVTTVAVVAIASAAAVILFAGIGALVGDHRITASAVVHSLASTVIYDVVLAPFVVPLVTGAVRRMEPVG